MPKNQESVGTVSAQGYVIRKASVFIDSNEIENPESAAEIRIIADMVWVNRADDHWSHNNDVTLKVDIDKEKFLMSKIDAEDEVVDVINAKEIFSKIMRVLVGSFRMPN